MSLSRKKGHTITKEYFRKQIDALVMPALASAEGFQVKYANEMPVFVALMGQMQALGERLEECNNLKEFNDIKTEFTALITRHDKEVRMISEVVNKLKFANEQIRTMATTLKQSDDHSKKTTKVTAKNIARAEAMGKLKNIFNTATNVTELQSMQDLVRGYKELEKFTEDSLALYEKEIANKEIFQEAAHLVADNKLLKAEPNSSELREGYKNVLYYVNVISALPPSTQKADLITELSTLRGKISPRLHEESKKIAIDENEKKNKRSSKEDKKLTLKEDSKSIRESHNSFFARPATPRKNATMKITKDFTNKSRGPK